MCTVCMYVVTESESFAGDQSLFTIVLNPFVLWPGLGKTLRPVQSKRLGCWRRDYTVLKIRHISEITGWKSPGVDVSL